MLVRALLFQHMKRAFDNSLRVIFGSILNHLNQLLTTNLKVSFATVTPQPLLCIARGAVPLVAGLRAFMAAGERPAARQHAFLAA